MKEYRVVISLNHPLISYRITNTTMATKAANVTGIKPLGDRILVKPIEEAEQIRGGIYIPDSAKEKPQEAKVVALGTGKRDEDGKSVPFEVKEGDVVLISKYGGTDVHVNDERHLILRESDILGILEK